MVEGYAAIEFVLNDGFEVLGHPEMESDDSITLLDTAGNTFDLPRARIVGESEVEESIMPGDLTRDLTVGEFASLLRYVKSLEQ